MAISKSIILAVIFIFIISAQIVLAAADCSGTNQTNADGTISICNPLGKDVTSPKILIGKVIKGVLGIVGSLALVMFIYGGFTWMTAAGASEKVTKGRDIIVWAVVGLIVIFSAYAGVKFVFDKVLAPPAAEEAATN